METEPVLMASEVNMNFSNEVSKFNNLNKQSVSCFEVNGSS